LVPSLEVTESPYASLPANRFWRPAVAEQTPETIFELYEKRFDIRRDTAISVAGDCFAQEFARELRAVGARVLDMEPPPPGLTLADATRFGYGLFSARHGNQYFARQLRQLIEEAYGLFEPEGWIWKRDGRYVDGLRPSVEPEGLGRPTEVIAHRQQHLQAVRAMFEATDVFIYAFGLNEAWEHIPSGTVFPTAPATIAGRFNPQAHRQKVFSYGDTYTDFSAVIALLHEINPEMKILMMLSPVPGTATITGQHILTANTRHKGILRAVAGAIYDEYESTDYFPAYELLATHFSEGRFYDANRRTISGDGLRAARRMFTSAHFAETEAMQAPPPAAGPPAPAISFEEDEDAVVCEDALLDAFA
jgi:hypothetical protein